MLDKESAETLGPLSFTVAIDSIGLFAGAAGVGVFSTGS